MDSQDSPSRLGKLMHRLRGRKRKPDGTEAIADGEEAYEAHSLLPQIVAGPGDRDKGNEVNTDIRQLRSTDLSMRPGVSMPMEASGSNQQEGEVGQVYSHPHSDVGVEVAEGSGPSREGNDPNREKVEQAYPSPSTSSIPRNRKPSDNENTSTPPYHVPKLLPGGIVESSAVSDKDKSSSEPTAPPSTELLRAVRDSSDAPTVLRSIAGDLCTILEHPERTTATERAIERLAPRVKALAHTLCQPIPPGDIEESRARRLERKLEVIHQYLTPISEQARATGFLANTENWERIDDLTEDIREAILEYRTSLQEHIYDESHRLIEPADLALLNRIRHTPDAGYRSGNREGCLKGTRRDVLWQIERWLIDEGDRRIFWLNGLAGTGKSTIAQTLAEMAFADGKLGASFFCSRDFEDRSNLHLILPTLAFQLAHQYPLFRKELLQGLRVLPDVGRGSLSSQMEKVIVGPLKATRTPTLIIIDALDECKDGEPISAILSVLSCYVDLIPNVKFFITGRPEPLTRSGLRPKSLLPVTEVLNLHEVKPEAVYSDIKLFFRTRLTDISECRSDCDMMVDWPDPSDIEILSKMAAGSFIYASTVIKFITSANHLPSERLAHIISLPRSTAEGRSGIDLLYTQVLERAVEYVGVDDEEFLSRFRTVVGAILLTFNPLSAGALLNLIRVSSVFSTLHSLPSLLLVPYSIEDPIRTSHKSFPDFLTDPERCTDKRFFVEPATHHAEILLSCLNLMKKGLKRNICNLDDHAVLSQVKGLSARRKNRIGSALEYACRFWTKHLLGIPSDSSHVEEVWKAIDEFFTTRFLFWIEVLVLTGNFDVGVYAVNDVERWYASTGISCKWTNDGQRFLSEHFDAIHDSPSQMYHSALQLCPTSSWLRKRYSTELSQEVKVVRGLPAEWGTCSRTVSFGGTPLALTCWSGLIAVGLWSGDITILDAITGGWAATHSAHTDRVGALAFSLDGTFLVSGSDDRSVKFWDVRTGGVIKSFHDHTRLVRSVSISPDCTMIASGSLDSTIRLWDVQSGECRCVINGLKGNINSVGFPPPNPQLLISASGNHTIQHWDVDGHQIGDTYDGDHATLSSDGAYFVSWRGGVATVRSVDSGAVFAELRVSDSDFLCCCFSPDGKIVAGGHTIYMWNITGPDPGHPVETLVGHTGAITSLTFSSPSSLISASMDNTVRFWQIGTLSMDTAVVDPEPAPIPSDPNSTPLPQIPITSISLQTRDDIAISSDAAGVVRTWDLSTGLCTASFHTAVKGGRDVRLVDGRLIIVCDGEDWADAGRSENRAGEFQIWDVERNELLRSVDTSECRVIDLWISGDGDKVFCLGEGSIRAWSTRTGEDVGGVTFRERLQPDSLAVAGSKVWVHFARSPPQGWDFGISGEPPVPLSNSSPNKPRLDITDCTDGSNTGAAKVKDAATGREFFQLSGRFSEPWVTQCNHRYLVAGYEFGEVLILDLLSGS